MTNPESFQDALHKALKKTKDFKSYELGKIPPQSVDLEEAVLGAVLLERYAFEEVSSILTAKSFYIDEHAQIFETCENLHLHSKPIDILTVIDELRQSNKLDFVGGAFKLTELTNRVGSASNIAYHAHIIKEKEILRNCIALSSEINKKSYDPITDAFELLDEIEAHLVQLQDVGTIKEPTTSKDAFKCAVAEYESKERGAGLISNLYKFDKTFNGFQGGDLIILGARPGMGKTAFALELAKQTACSGMAGAIFSLEMSETQLMQRLVSNFERIPLENIKNKDLSDPEFEQFVNSDVVSLPIFIDDSFSQTVGQIKSKATKLKKKHDIGYIIIDYLQLIKPPDRYKGNKVHEIGYISRALKGIAKDLNIPVIALSQLSRSVEKRDNKRPRISDLRDSGDIEQDADVVFFLYRDEYYQDENTELDLADGGETEVIIAKYRSGESNTMTKCRFHTKYQTFTELEDRL